MKKKIQKPFDVEAAKNGAIIETKNGRSVRILCYDKVSDNYPIVALVNSEGRESCHSYTLDGEAFASNSSGSNLVIVEEVEYPKFKEGDWVFMNTHGSRPWLVIKVAPNSYEIKDSFGDVSVKSHHTIDSLFHPWTLKDAKPGSVLCYADDRPFMFKELHDEYPVAYFGIDYEDSILIGNGMIWTDKPVRPATFKEYNRLFKQLKEENYEYNVDTHEITKKEISWRNNEGLSTKISGYYINIDSSISSYDDGILCKNSYNVFSTKKQAKAALAMARISQIIANDERFGGIVTDEEWIDKSWYSIIRINNDLRTATRFCYELLSFHTKKQADLFLEENRDLIKDYYMID